MGSVTTQIRVGVLSADSTLSTLLSSVLGREFVTAQVPILDRPDAVEVNRRFDALLLDFDPRSAPSRQWATFLHSGKHSFTLPVVLMSEEESRRDALAFVERGANGYVRKPPVVPELRAILRKVCERRSLKGEHAVVDRQMENNIGLDQLTGLSTSMQAVYRLVRKVANLDASVLIRGESGTGKELTARAIHNTGNRATRPFVAVSCGAIPETLIESELFGCEKGAFTGSVGTRAGYFEQAGDGTLFLDEIGELRLTTQVKLLRVLQERQFSRLGLSRAIPLRARVVFATHRDLEQMVAEGNFRQDLFYRVNVMNIVMPALREHSEDIPALVQHFLQRYSELYRKPVEGVEPEALSLLQRYSWPGNVRELENTIQRAVILAEGYALTPGDLPEYIQEQEGIEFEDDLPAGSFERLLRDYKYKLASEAVQQCHGNKTLAAQSLSISRAYLHRLLRQTSEYA